MRIKSLQLHGFKSFVDPTSVNFPSNMCAIVGPNGCGKSNVVDAIKWVLGERSSKSLRGKEMIDCIFAGSAVRKPSGMAAVTLSFDNPKSAAMLADLAGTADESKPSNDLDLEIEDVEVDEDDAVETEV